MFNENTVNASREVVENLAKMAGEAMSRGEGPEGYTDQIAKVIKDAEQKYGIDFDDVPNELENALRGLSSNLLSDVLSGIAGKVGVLFMTDGEPSEQENDSREIHDVYHESGLDAAHYNRKDFSVAAIQYHGKRNLLEVAKFCIDHEIAFTVRGEALFLGGMDGAKPNVHKVEISEWILSRESQFTIRSCESFVMEYDLPISVQRQQAADEEFEANAKAERLSTVEDSIDDLLDDES